MDGGWRTDRRLKSSRLVTASRTELPAPAFGFGGVVVATKLHAPLARPGLVTRDRLYATLTSGGPRRLTVVEAPPGSGKTTLVAQWQASDRETRPFAWLSLDEGDNDPAQFWTYVVEALRTVEGSGFGSSAVALLSAREDVRTLALPALINELAGLERELVLVLDDYHVIVEPAIHEELAYLLERLPPTLEVALTTRVSPPLRLARLRARGELVHIRAGELRFNPTEATALLAELGLDLEAADVAQLQERTEGWAAGLYLAALSLRGRTDAHAFVEQFAGDDRHVVDYLGGELLEDQTEPIRHFLLRTSILTRLSAPLCDALLGLGGSLDLLGEIERSNLFLVPLDERREWYRYHHLFGQLLALELHRAEPGLVPELHRAASRWLREHGDVGEAIHHAAAAGDVRDAADLIADHWRSFFNHGRLATVTSWLDSLPAETVEGDRRLAAARAWLALDLGRLEEAERWIGHAEATGEDIDAETALLGAVCRFKLGDLKAAHDDAVRAMALAPDALSFEHCVAQEVLGVILYWLGEDEQASALLASVLEPLRLGRNELGAAYALGYLALIHAAHGMPDEAEERAASALGEGDDPGFAEHFVLTVAHLALARAMQLRGRLTEVHVGAERAAELSRRGAGMLERAAALLELAEDRHSNGDPARARELCDEAAAIVERCAHPGIARDRVDDVRRRRGRAHRSRAPELRDELSDRELAVLRLLPSGLSQREIGSELFVSLNTIKTHLRNIYRKLGVDGREDAVERARELRLI
jgi:LuxR family transcriptional regulator, maltose regulon positive regulatory protein